jgi:hypothetical protein
MKRWAMVALLLSHFLLARGPEARAAHRRPFANLQRGSYSEYLLVRRPNSQPQIRHVYNGYANGFPPPAFLYYGYPHSGDETGIGPMDRK